MTAMRLRLHGDRLRTCFKTPVVLAAAAVVAAMLLGAGCANYRTERRYEQGLVLVLPGAEGRGLLNRQIVDGLAGAGVPYALEIHDWTTGISLLFVEHQMNLRHNRIRAQAIADRMRAYADEHPGRPIWLVGHSAGGAMAVLALEALPDDFQVEGAALIAPSISGDYNLAGALTHVSKGIYNYYSRLDLLFLGVGTLAIGNVDGGRGASAGRVGFSRPEGLSPREAEFYALRLEQLDCSGQALEKGHIGLHLTSSSPTFIKKVVAPNIWQPKAEAKEGSEIEEGGGLGATRGARWTSSTSALSCARGSTGPRGPDR